MSDLAAVQVVVHGRVHGVFFRAFTEHQAEMLGLAGYVRNLPSEEAVEVWAEGERDKLKTLIFKLSAGPPTAKVTKVTTKWSAYTGRYTGFSIRY
jgi:acylphosphatase